MRTVLVIDDNPLVRSFVDIVLTQAGWNVVAAPTAQAGLDVIASTRLNLIMLDIMLPDMSGMRLLDILKAKRALATPIMMMTGKGDTQTVRSCIAAGAAGYLVKPFGPNDLLSRVHVCLHPRRVEAVSEPVREALFI